MKEERKPCLHAHVKWFYGQSERAYYLNYFIKFDCASVLHIPIVHAHDVSKHPSRKKFSFGLKML